MVGPEGVGDVVGVAGAAVPVDQGEVPCGGSDEGVAEVEQPCEFVAVVEEVLAMQIGVDDSEWFGRCGDDLVLECGEGREELGVESGDGVGAEL